MQLWQLFLCVCFIIVPTDLAMRKKAVEKRLTNELTMFRKNTTELASDASKNLEQLQKLAKVVCRAEEMNEQFEGSRDELLQVSKVENG